MIFHESCSVDGCDRAPRSPGPRSSGLCSAHYKRSLKDGTPGGPEIAPKRWVGYAARMLAIGAAAIDDGPCIEIDRRKRRPQVLYGGVRMSASRAVWFISDGDPGELLVLHACGRGAQGCVRRGHLYLGDALQNARDKILHGTNRPGEQNARAKLTDENVREARRDYATGRWTLAELGSRYGVTGTSISYAVRRKTWRHVA